MAPHSASYCFAPDESRILYPLSSYDIRIWHFTTCLLHLTFHFASILFYSPARLSFVLIYRSRSHALAQGPCILSKQNIGINKRLSNDCIDIYMIITLSSPPIIPAWFTNSLLLFFWRKEFPFSYLISTPFLPFLSRPP